MTTLEKVRAKIIEAVPEIRTYETRCMTCGYGFKFCKCVPQKTEWFRERPITLADVLKTMGATGQYGISCSPLPNTEMADLLAVVNENLVSVSWNLTLPLDGQEPEVVEFLAKVLDV